MKNTKKCGVCNLYKEIENFQKRKNKPEYRCKECVREYHKKYYKKNQEALRKRTAEFRKENPDYMIKWRKENKEKIKINKINYLKKNKEKINQNEREKRKRDKAYKIKKNLRRRVNLIIKRGGKKSKSTMQLLGCDTQYFFTHLENKFTDGMNWENYGNNGWHIDHIVPCASFDLTEEEQQSKCFHYTNLQPLWASDNIRKGDKIL